MIKNKISDTIYEVYVGRYPSRIKLPVYRGDAFSFTLIGFNWVDDSPYDFSLYDAFNAQLRIGAPENSQTIYEFDETEFVLGERTEGSGILNELHIVSATALDFKTFYPKVWMDIRASIGDENNTLTKLELQSETDVTR